MSQSSDSKEEDVFSLLLKAMEGDSAALQGLLDHPEVRSRALAICNRTIRRTPSVYYRDAEDLRQDLFISFCQNLDKFRCEHGEASFWQLLKILARNIHLSLARKTTREMEQSEEKDINELPIASRQDPHFNLAIAKALDSLDERELAILEHRVDGEGLVEIAANVPFPITKSTVQRVVVNIQKKFIACVDGCKDQETAKRARKRKSKTKKPQ